MPNKIIDGLTNNQRYYKRNVVDMRARSTRWYQEHPEQARERYKAWLVKLRNGVFEHYGTKCACCGETERVFLTIDHVDGGGNQHRKTLRPSGSHKASSVDFYRWLRKNKYPKGFQTLCRNCNVAKYRFGICPHEAERARESFTIIGISC